MIREIRIETIDQAMGLIKDQERNEKINRLRSAYFYRGMPNAAYRLETSLARNCKQLQTSLEGPILSNFTKYASIEDPTLAQSIWKQMIVGQHHGLPTRLLDWTHSPLVALHFALSEPNMENLSKRDCVIWRIDAHDVNRNLPERYQALLRERDAFIFSVEQMKKLANSLEQYDQDMGDRSFVMLEPPSVDQRIMNQYAFFSVIPLGMHDISGFLDTHTEKTCRYIIDKSVRWDLRDMLDQFNISERIIYPGLDGLSKWIARHYFVKE